MGLFHEKGKSGKSNDGEELKENIKTVDVDLNKLSIVPSTNFEELDKSSKVKNEIDSDVDYRHIVWEIVNNSSEQLKKQNSSKSELKISFVKFFRPLLSVQLGFLFAVVILKGFLAKCFIISDNVLIALISFMFVETLGAIVLMIKYAFNSDQEVKILEILNNVVKDYQKFNTKSGKDNTSHSK